MRRTEIASDETTILSWYFLYFSFQISRQSIDACKDHFREDLNNADWKLMIELKKLFQIL